MQVCAAPGPISPEPFRINRLHHHLVESRGLFVT